MAKTYAAFYLPQEEPVVPVANEKEAQSLASTITGLGTKPTIMSLTLMKMTSEIWLEI